MRKRIIETAIWGTEKSTTIVKRRNLVGNIILGEMIDEELLKDLGLTEESLIKRAGETLEYAVIGKNDEFFTNDDTYHYIIKTSTDELTAKVLYVLDLETLNAGDAFVPPEILMS